MIFGSPTNTIPTHVPFLGVPVKWARATSQQCHTIESATPWMASATTFIRLLRWFGFLLKCFLSRKRYGVAIFIHTAPAYWHRWGAESIRRLTRPIRPSTRQRCCAKAAIQFGARQQIKPHEPNIIKNKSLIAQGVCTWCLPMPTTDRFMRSTKPIRLINGWDSCLPLLRFNLACLRTTIQTTNLINDNFSEWQRNNNDNDLV